jgi:hypothetical protein
VRIIRSNPKIADSDLAAALVAGTEINADEANALVRTVAHHAPTAVEGPHLHDVLLRQIATVLERHGYAVAFDASQRDGQRHCPRAAPRSAWCASSRTLGGAR